jgi:hypothetical protein
MPLLGGVALIVVNGDSLEASLKKDRTSMPPSPRLQEVFRQFEALARMPAQPYRTKRDGAQIKVFKPQRPEIEVRTNNQTEQSSHKELPVSAVPKARAKAAPESRDTQYIDRVVEALALLCGGKIAPRELVVDWEENRSEALQDWAADNGAARWGTGLGAIEAAQVLANAPQEGRGHQLREEAYPEPEGDTVESQPANELAEKLSRAFGEEWTLSLSAAGNGSLETDQETIYFGCARELDDLSQAELTQ